MCEQVAPGLIHLDDNAEPVFDLDDMEAALRPLAELAVQSCPVAALNICSTSQTISHE